MAGAGYKLFNTGDVLTAAQVNTYLQEQVVMVFANAAARTTALSGVLAEGMVTYLKDTDALEIYSGTAWVGYGSGDITAVVAGTGLSGGATSGSATLSLTVPVVETNGGTAQTTYATGDILYASASNTLSKRTIGTTGQVLTVSGGVPTWATPAGGSPSFVGCKLTKSVDQTITNVTNTVITFDGEDFDTDNFHSNTTNNSRITIPTGKAGKYLFVVSGNFTGAGATGHLQTNMRKNGTAVAAGAANIYWKNQTDVIGFTMSHILDAAVADYFEFFVYSNPGNNAGNITDTTRFSCQWLGA